MNEGDDNLPATLAGVGTEIASIQVGSSAYWRDEAQQVRYRQLLGRREALTGEQEPAKGAENPIAIPSRSEFEAVHPGGDYAGFIAIMRDVGDVYLATPGPDRAALVSTFEALPATVTAAMVDELRNRASVASELLQPDDWAEFTATEHGKVLVAAWGANAAAKVGKVDGRLRRIADQLSGPDFSAFLQWVQGLTSGAALSVCRKLAA